MINYLTMENTEVFSQRNKADTDWNEVFLASKTSEIVSNKTMNDKLMFTPFMMNKIAPLVN